jgi:hypothetical protein
MPTILALASGYVNKHSGFASIDVYPHAAPKPLLHGGFSAPKSVRCFFCIDFVVF